MHTLILGFDSFDPITFENLSAQGKLPNLTKYADAGNYARFKVSDPPQTEVSWTSIATGLDPGWHGIFDFVHRDPATYTPFVSLLPTKRSLLGLQFIRPNKAHTIFEEAVEMGYPATTLWWPATFPAQLQSPVRTIPGLGTPDIKGRLGVGTLFTTDLSISGSGYKTAVKILDKNHNRQYSSTLEGPEIKKKNRAQTAELDLSLEITGDKNAKLKVGSTIVTLNLGEWSDILDISFKVSFLISTHVQTRVILTQIQPEIKIYFLPLQIHPLHSPWRYATPPSFVKKTWKAGGPFLTLGWPQDTTGLEEGCINDNQFLALCDSIFSNRENILFHLLDSFNEGILAAVFDGLDRVQHMFRRDRPDIVEQWYVRLDSLVGRAEKRLRELGKQQVNFFVISDHGFADFQYKVHLNRWLVDNGYLITTNENGNGSISDADWSRSQAYAIGLNSLYINLAGREGAGSVEKVEYQSLLSSLINKLTDWKGTDGKKVIQRVLLREDAFTGPLSEYSPDVLIGYSPGYRASPETGLGLWKNSSIEVNQDHWGADHCIDSLSVPGVFFSSQGLQGISNPSYRDIPQFAIGKELDGSKIDPPPPPITSGEEDQKVIEDRLKSLGYL